MSWSGNLDRDRAATSRTCRGSRAFWPFPPRFAFHELSSCSRPRVQSQPASKLKDVYTSRSAAESEHVILRSAVLIKCTENGRWPHVISNSVLVLTHTHPHPLTHQPTHPHPHTPLPHSHSYWNSAGLLRGCCFSSAVGRLGPHTPPLPLPAS